MSEENRIYTEEEIVYFDLKELFEEEFQSTFNEPWSKKEKIDFLKQLGIHYDAQFYRNTSIDPKDFIKQHPSYYTFSEIIEYRITGEKTKRQKQEKPQKDKTPNEKHKIKMSKALVQDKGLTFALLEQVHGRTEIEGLTYKTWQLIDCIGHAIVEKYGFFRNLYLPTESGDKLLLPQSPKELNGMLRVFDKMRKIDPQRYEESSFRVRLSALSIRKKLNKLNSMKNSDVHEEMKNLNKGSIICESPTFYLEELGKMVTYGEMKHVCYIKFIKVEDRKKHSPEPEYYYEIIFDQDKVGLVFFSNLLLGHYKFLPDKSVFYSKLKGGSQMIFRAINSIQKKIINVPLIGLITLCQLKDKKPKQAKKTIEGYLNELKERKFIKDWTVRGRKYDEIWYEIFK